MTGSKESKEVIRIDFLPHSVCRPVCWFFSFSFLISKRTPVHQHSDTPGSVPELWDMEGSVARRRGRVDEQRK